MKGNSLTYSDLCKIAQVCLSLVRKRKRNLHFIAFYGVFITAYPKEALVTLTRIIRLSISYSTFRTYVICYPLLSGPIPAPQPFRKN